MVSHYGAQANSGSAQALLRHAQPETKTESAKGKINPESIGTQASRHVRRPRDCK
jgi:hypothetical protein